MLITAALGAAAAVSATSNPSAPVSPPAHEHRDRHDGPGGEFHQVLEQLDLTAEQKQKIQSIFAQAKPQLEALGQSSRANREQLAITPPTDPAYAGMVAAAKTNAADHIQLTSDLWRQTYVTLTPAQQARIPGIVAAERAKWDERKADWKRKRAAN
jgi:Spy/CpxP family protein refolding chaperone